MPPRLSVRIRADRPDHHLWWNHGSWWVHYVLYEGERRRRVRFSLQTRHVGRARQLRDELFAALRAAGRGAAPVVRRRRALAVCPPPPGPESWGRAAPPACPARP